MAREDDIEPAGAAPVLKGLAKDLAIELRRRASAFMAKAAENDDLDAAMRAVVAIARAGSAVHALQAAEDRADERMTNARAARAAARERAKTPTFDEGDETDMNERDPRLDTPEGVAEIYQDARQGLERFFRHLETKQADRSRAAPADERRAVGAGEKLAAESAPAPTPT